MRIPTHSRYGMGLLGDCRQLMSGSLPTGNCQDLTTGAIGPCDASGCPTAPVEAPVYTQTYFGAAPISGPSDYITTYASGIDEPVSVPTLISRLMDDMNMRTRNVYMLRAGLLTPPDQCLQRTAADVQAYCALYPGACQGLSTDQIIEAVCGEYTRWYNSNLAEYWELVHRGSIEPVPGAPPPPPGYVAPTVFVSGPGYQLQQQAYQQQVYQQTQNALDRVVPQTGSITPTEPTSALRPPSSQPALNAQDIQYAQGTDVLTTRPGEAPAMPISNWIQDNWALLAAGAAALILLPMMGGRR